jgi:hypothetical protein
VVPALPAPAPLPAPVATAPHPASAKPKRPARPVKNVAAHPAPPPHPPLTHTPEQVQAKFRTVKSEYAAFKSQYGAVLEDKWNAIATEVTFGKADKFEKVDAMLDALRHEMAKVRAGG